MKLTGQQRHLAAQALHFAVTDRLVEAIAAVNDLGRSAPHAVPQVMLAWIDTALTVAGVPGRGGPRVRVGLLDERDPGGAIQTVHNLGDDDTRWAARLFTARLNDDEGAYLSLLGLRASDEQWGAGVTAVLRMAAGTIRAARDGQPVGFLSGSNKVAGGG